MTGQDTNQRKIVLEMPEIINVASMKNVTKNDNVQFCWKVNKNVERVTFNFAKIKDISPTGIVLLRMLRDAVVLDNIEPYYRKPEAKSTNFFIELMELVKPTKQHKDDISKEQYKEEKLTEDEMHFNFSIHACKSTFESETAHKEIIKALKEIFPDMDKKTCASIDYILTEIRDNAGVHGYECYDVENYPSPVYICGSEYNGKIEIAIGDLGQGIWKSLTKNNKQYADLKNKDAVVEALKDGVSGHPNRSPGFGLYSSKEILSKGGVLHIWSSDCYVESCKGKEKVFTTSFPKGTIVTFVIDTSALLSFDEVFELKGISKTVQSHIDDFFMEV